jgi:hypothetical protein
MGAGLHGRDLTGTASRLGRPRIGGSAIQGIFAIDRGPPVEQYRRDRILDTEFTVVEFAERPGAVDVRHYWYIYDDRHNPAGTGNFAARRERRKDSRSAYRLGNNLV